MSIRQVQIQRVLEGTVRALYSTGHAPTLNDILTEVSHYFAQFPAGTAIPINIEFTQANGRSDPNAFNQIMARTITNLQTLYMSSLIEVDNIMQMTSVLRAKLELLDAKRTKLATKVDDYLLSLFNTDGYYYSTGDSFADTAFVDLTMTSAFVDTTIGAVTLPTISSLTRQIPAALVSLTDTKVSVTPLNQTVTTTPNQNYPYSTISPISGALDGLTNTVWSIEVDCAQPSEVVATITLSLGGNNAEFVKISRVDVDPYGITPVQAFVEAGIPQESSTTVEYQSFGNVVQSSLNKMSFIDSLENVSAIRVTFRKTLHDFVTNDNDTVRYKYIFGAKEISMVESVYDNAATFVSDSIQIPSELIADAIIDAVSLTVDQQVLPDTDIAFYVANDPIVLAQAPQLSDFDWQRIEPIGTFASSDANIVRFNGAQAFRRKITPKPGPSELQLLPIDFNNPDISKRNPNRFVVPGVDIYRICKFDEDYLLNSVRLEEGVDTSRIYHTALDFNGVAGGLQWWYEKINSTTPPEIVYGKIDKGNEFFYGGDVGASGRSIYAETYVELVDDHQSFLGDFRKSDPNSLIWNVKVYLNGREIGSLPSGTQHLLIPWTFKQGLNHIALLVNIPVATSDMPNPYIGTLSLLGDDQLSDFGTVKLGNWSNVSFFDLQYNQAREPTSFTIFNNEIITRKPPTTDFVISYSKDTKQGPNGVRLRADLSRSANNPNVTPRLDSYRMRFSYAKG